MSTSEFDLNITMDRLDGSNISDNVNIKVTYPENRAIAAIQAVRAVGEEPRYMMGLIKALENDPSVKAAMEKTGLTILDEDGNA